MRRTLSRTEKMKVVAIWCIVAVIGIPLVLAVLEIAWKY